MINKIAKISVMLLILSLTACWHSLPTKYYLLQSTNASTEEGNESGKIVLLRPISLPSYLDRKAIVTRSGDNELSISDLNLWAESLDKNMERIISEELINSKSVSKVKLNPNGRDSNYSKQITIEVSRFERIENSDVRLDARVTIADNSGVESASKIILVDETCTGTTYSDTARCMSKSITSLTEQIKPLI